MEGQLDRRKVYCPLTVPVLSAPGRSILFSKHLLQIHAAIIQHIDLRLVFFPVDLRDVEDSIHELVHLNRFGSQVNNPVFPDTGLLVQIQLHHPVLSLGGRGQHLHHHVRGTFAAPVVQFAAVADD